VTNPNDSNPPPDTLLIHAYVDGELDPANALALERRMAAEPALAAERARLEALRGALRDRLPREAAPAGLVRRVERTIGTPRATAGPSWRALAASVMLAVIAGSGGTWLALRPAADNRFASELVDGHMRALMASQAVDVVSSDRHTVKPWFNGRIPQSPRVVDLAQDGFPLVGGRIDVVGGTPVPTLVYRHRQHVISLLALPATGRGGGAPRAINGYNLVGWTADGTAYWAVSDLGAADLERFALLFRSSGADR
jgi:anti-sigma factor RsiW